MRLDALRQVLQPRYDLDVIAFGVLADISSHVPVGPKKCGVRRVQRMHCVDEVIVLGLLGCAPTAVDREECNDRIIVANPGQY